MDYCDQCSEPFEDGDGARCERCSLTLCYACFGRRADAECVCVMCLVNPGGVPTGAKLLELAKSNPPLPAWFDEEELP